MKRIFSFLCLIAFLARLHAQTQLPVPQNIKAAFEKQTRSYDGRAGKITGRMKRYTILM